MDPSFSIAGRSCCMVVVAASSSSIAASSAIEGSESGDLAGRFCQPLDYDDGQPQQVHEVGRQVFHVEEEEDHFDELLEEEEPGTLEDVKKKLSALQKARGLRYEKAWKAANRLRMRQQPPEVSNLLAGTERFTQWHYFEDEDRVKRILQAKLALQNPLAFEGSHVQAFISWLKLKGTLEDDLQNYFSLLAQIKGKTLLYPNAVCDLEYQDRKKLKKHFNSMKKSSIALVNCYRNITNIPTLNSLKSRFRKPILAEITALCETVSNCPDPLLNETIMKCADDLKDLENRAPTAYFREIVLDRIYTLEAAIDRAEKSPFLQSVIDKLCALKKTIQESPGLVFRQPMIRQIAVLNKMITSQLAAFNQV